MPGESYYLFGGLHSTSYFKVSSWDQGIFSRWSEHMNILDGKLSTGLAVAGIKFLETLVSLSS